MSIKLISKQLFLLIFSLGCFLFSGCGKLDLYSSWRDREIIIDSKYTDWGSSSTYYYEKARTVLNLANDSDYMYICLISRNREVEVQIMESGLLVWFDPGAKKEKTFGIRFPVGLKRVGVSLQDKDRDITRDWEDQIDKSELIDRDQERFTNKDFNKRLETLEGLQERLEIVGESGHFRAKDKRPKPPLEEFGKEDMGKKMERRDGFSKDGPREISLEEAKKFGIEAKVGRENGYFVYELKVPLVKSALHPYAIGLRPDRIIGLGLEIAGSVGGPGGGMPSGNGGDEGDRMPPGGMDSGSGRYSGKSLQLWAIVTLSSAA
ncbi:MAG: hypothetical protein WC578_00745 [Candidatus Omnitrophota bacterium]|jgi:hypothetical protein